MCEESENVQGLFFWQFTVDRNVKIMCSLKKLELKKNMLPYVLSPVAVSLGRHYFRNIFASSYRMIPIFSLNNNLSVTNPEPLGTCAGLH